MEMQDYGRIVSNLIAKRNRQIQAVKQTEQEIAGFQKLQELANHELFEKANEDEKKKK